MSPNVPPKMQLWTGRKSGSELYLHEKIKCIIPDKEEFVAKERSYAILGYACDEGVRRNQGRPGASAGPDAIRQQLAKLPNHLPEDTQLLDMGSIACIEKDMEGTQALLETEVCKLLQQGVFPILLGGGHDIAYGHYNGIKRFLKNNETIGVINFDAHFDLRNNATGNNSGTPFYQIAADCKASDSIFKYMCLGIREEANDKNLFNTALELGVDYSKIELFSIHRLEHVKREINIFTDKVDHIYVTIDLDGFSSAYAPGVSAASPLGFSPAIVMESLKSIVESKKLISVDVAEMNPTYDIDNQTAKLAAGLVHFILHKMALL